MLYQIQGKILRNKQLQICFIVTFVIGLVAHGFVFLNAMYIHDSANYVIDKNIWRGVISGTSRMTPFSSIWSIFLPECRVSWLAGIIELLCYSISSYVVVITLKIHSSFLTAIVSSIMIVSPATISANTYAISITNSFTLLFSCLAAYFFFSQKRYSNIIAILALIIATGSYGPFISVAFAIVIIRAFRDFAEDDDTKRMLKRIVELLFFCVLSVFCVLLLCLAINHITHYGYQVRVARALDASNSSDQVTSYISIGDGFVDIIVKTINNAVKTILFFFPKGVSYRLGFDLPKNSFLVDNHLLLISLYIAALSLFYTVCMKSKRIAFILMLIVLGLFISMDIYGLFTASHLLMKYSFIAPWLLMICMADLFNESAESYCRHYKYMTYWLGVITTISGIYLANEAYAKEQAIYKSGLLLANRVVDHLESIDGYVPGETEVYFTGNLRKYYAPERDEFELVRDITGIESPFYDIAMTYNVPFVEFMNDQIGVDIKYAVNPPYTYAYGAEWYADILIEAGFDIDKESFIMNYQKTSSFPNQNNYFWIGDILVFKLIDM